MRGIGVRASGIVKTLGGTIARGGALRSPLPAPRSPVALIAAAIALCAAALWAQQRDPFEGVGPHDVPHCTPTGKGKAAARCGCTGMVGQVHEAIALSCWKQAGVEKPDEFLLDHPTKEVLACMEANHLDHCQVVADLWNKTQQWGVKYDPKKACRTACKPERCGCADSACKAHGEGAGY